MSQEFFNEMLNDEPNRPINLGEAVEYGTAVQGAVLTVKALHSAEAAKLQQAVTEADIEER